MTPAEDPFQVVRVRAVSAVIALCALAILLPQRPIQQWLGADLAVAAIDVALYALVFAVLAWLCARVGVKFRRLFGPAPSLRGALRAAAPAIPLVALSFGTLYAVCLPLSYLAPSFVEGWLLEGGLPFVAGGGAHAWTVNLLTAASACLLAPVVEEFVFRGLFLHRWALRWNLRRSILLTSVLFGLLHADPLGSMVFAVVGAILYLETRSLYAPIVMHATHNGLVCLVVAAEQFGMLGSSEEAYDLATFRAEWWQGAIGLALGGPWALYWLRAHWRPDAWTLPHRARWPRCDLPEAVRARREG